MQYTVGTVTVQDGSTSVTGTSTKWLANIDSTWIFMIIGDDIFYEIASVNSDTSITLLNPYDAGTRVDLEDLSYAIVKDYTFNYQWPTIAHGDVQWPVILTESLRRIDRDLHEMPMGKGMKYIVLEAQSVNPATLSASDYTGRMYLYSGDIYYSDGSQWLQLSGTPI